MHGQSLKHHSDSKFWSIANMVSDPLIAIVALPLPANETDMERTGRFASTPSEINHNYFLGLTPDSPVLQKSHQLLHGTWNAYQERGFQLTFYVIPLHINHPVFRMPPAAGREAVFNLVREELTRDMRAGDSRILPRDPSVNQDILINIKCLDMGNRMSDNMYANTVIKTMNMLQAECLTETVQVESQIVSAKVNATAGYAARSVMKAISDVFAKPPALPQEDVVENEDQTNLTLLQRSLLLDVDQQLDIELVYTDSYEYPREQIEEFGGIPQNTEYTYVSSTFLNGLVNYGKNHRSFLVARYGLDSTQVDEAGTEESYFVHLDAKYGSDNESLIAQVRQDYQAFADKSFGDDVHHTTYNQDDWIVMYETSESYVFMWYDRDCSDCSIERYSIESCIADAGIDNLDDFAVQRLALLRKHQTNFLARYNGIDEFLVFEPKNNRTRGWISG